jgi:pimeloyl-ACP methyl ester carboxylesterase
VRRLFVHCIAAATAIPAAAIAQTPAVEPTPGTAAFTILVRGRNVGREQVTVARTPSGWTISSTGSQGPPFDITLNRFEVKYAPDWQPVELHLEALVRGDSMTLSTTFGVTTASSEITRNSVTNTKTDQISARAIVLPSGVSGAYEALAARLSAAEPGAELPIYVAPTGEARLRVRTVTPVTIEGPSGRIETRRYEVTFENPSGPFEAVVSVDGRHRLVRLELPAASLVVARDDASSVSMRSVVARNPNDTDVTVAANGFNLAGTLTSPAAPGRLRHPAIVLVAGSGPIDRDETVAGIPIFAQLARMLSESGYIVLRYDKRGVGQSGGRTETATLTDYADDAVAAVKWLASRKDVDRRHIALAGHSEGGAVAMLAAAREGRIGAVILIAAPGSTGADLILEQQRHLLAGMNMSEAEKQQKIELQQKIQAAVIAGGGWEGIPPELRKQADTPLFRSLLTFDPAAAMTRVKQPILIVQGDLDTQVAPANADRLGALAKERKKAPASELVHIAGVNHLLVPASTGEVSEYAQLRDRSVSPKVAEAIGQWLKKIWGVIG